jgi:hypothetical protein
VVADKFKVFISWSGQQSQAVAAVWLDLISETFDSVEPFMSEENIGAGERGLAKIATELAGTSFGIIVVTQENQKSPWLNYEAGSLSKDVDDQTVRVAPSLVDFERKTDVTGPIGQFQASLLNREGVEYILVEIAKIVGADEASIRKRLTNSWREEYETRFNSAKTAGGDEPVAQRRGNDEILDEILTIVRELARSPMQSEAAALSAQLFPASASFSGGVESPSVNRAPLVLEPGDRIQHDKYGVGRVEEVTGEGESAMSLVDFGSVGRVKLMHNHASVVKIRG